MKFFLCSKLKNAVKPTIHWNSDIPNQIYLDLDLKITVFLADIGHLVKLLRNHWATVSPENLGNISNIECWGLTLVAYKKSLVTYNFSFYIVHAFFISNTFISNANASKRSATPWGWTFAIIHILHSWYHPKITGHILKIKKKNKRVCFHEITWLIIVKLMMKMKNRSHRRETVLGPDIQ